MLIRSTIFPTTIFWMGYNLMPKTQGVEASYDFWRLVSWILGQLDSNEMKTQLKPCMISYVLVSTHCDRIKHADRAESVQFAFGGL